VKSIQYYDFQFRHRIDLREYFKKYYSLDFKSYNGNHVCTTDPNLSIHIGGKYENTWVRADITSSTKSDFGVYLKYGTVIDWESIKHDCSVVKAVQIVTNNRNSLPAYKTSHYKKLESLFTKTATRFRYSRLPEVVDYLNNRGIDHTSYAKEFNLGSPKSYDSLVIDLTTANTPAPEVQELLTDLFIVRRPLNFEYLPFVPSVIVPVHDKVGDLIGFHGRRVSPGTNQRYYNTGFLRDCAKDVLYGEDKSNIVSAIGMKQQLILTKGIFDFFACYQNGYIQVLATLNKGISVQQFDRVMKYPVTEVVVGHIASKERETLLGLMHQSLSTVDLSLIDTAQDIDDTVKSGTSLSDIVSNALKNMKATEAGIIAASIKKRKVRMDTLAELGQTFLVQETDLGTLINTSKRSPRKIKDFLLEEGNKGRAVVQNGGFIRFPKTFITTGVLDGFGAELRTLLYLLLKTKGRDTPINYTQSSLRTDLELSQAVLIDHLKKLKLNGYLLWKKEIHIKKLKTKQKRTVVFRYYSSSIKFG